MSRLRAVAMLTAAIAVVAIAGGCKQKNSDGGVAGPSGTKGRSEVLLGQFASLTGGTATFGESQNRGVTLAVEQANAGGGVNGKQIKLVTEDTQSKPDTARTVATKLISQDKVLALVGEVASTRTMAAAPIAQDAHIPIVTPCSTNPAVTKRGDYVFRACFTDDFQAAVAAHFGFDQGWRKAAIFTDMRQDYSVAFGRVFKAEFEKLGGKVVSEQSYQSLDQDFKAQLTTIKSASPDCVLVPGYYSEVGTIGRQAREIGLNVPLFGGDGWESPKLYESAQGALEGCFYTNHYFSVTLKEPATQKFVADYQAKFGAAPDAIAALSYDTTRIVIDAMKKAKTLDGPGIREALLQTKDFPGVAGKVTFDANRDARKSAIVMQIKGKDFVVFKSYTPEQIGK